MNEYKIEKVILGTGSGLITEDFLKIPQLSPHTVVVTLITEDFLKIPQLSPHTVVVTLITEDFLKIPQLSPHTKKTIYDIIEMLLKLTLKNDNSIWMTYTCIL